MKRGSFLVYPMIFLISLAALGVCAKIALGSAEKQLNLTSLQGQAFRDGANQRSSLALICGSDAELSRQYLQVRKELSRVDVDTSGWYKGNRVVDGGALPGMVIAIFDDWGRYHSNCAIFQGYITDENGSITGFEVQVRNSAYGNAMGKHTLYPSENGIDDAGEYFVVMSKGQPIEI